MSADARYLCASSTSCSLQFSIKTSFAQTCLYNFAYSFHHYSITTIENTTTTTTTTTTTATTITITTTTTTTTTHNNDHRPWCQPSDTWRPHLERRLAADRSLTWVRRTSIQSVESSHPQRRTHIRVDIDREAEDSHRSRERVHPDHPGRGTLC